MIYIEFIDRDRSMPIEIFRRLGNQGSDWAEGSEDRMLLQLGRTLRLGPVPNYLCLWEIPDLQRLDAWEDYFRSPAAAMNSRSLAMHRAIHIQRAGLYDALFRATSLEAPLYIVEYLEPGHADADQIRSAVAKRAARHAPLAPLLLLRRLGRAGPDPALLCVWSTPGWEASEALLREEPANQMRLVDLGVYRRFGQEVL